MPNLETILIIVVILVLLYLIYKNIFLNQLISSLKDDFREDLKNLRLETLNTIVSTVNSQNEILHRESLESEQKLELIRQSIEKKLDIIQSENSRKVDNMREVVDKRLQYTLETRISESFKLVNDRLEQVYKGLGEMQSLAIGVGDLKKVISNVKTRGVLGELQLASIIKDILPKEQYEENVITKKGSQNFVEFAIKLPGDDRAVYLPVDAKFPYDSYMKLLDSYDLGELDIINNSKVEFVNRLKSFAKDISEKYIDIPNTTEFAIMFLPFEGMYSEAINLGVFEYTQRKYNIVIAGPTTMAVILNSLQMGFRTLAIQKQSSEVWSILAGVKQEFDNFETVLLNAQKKIDSVSNELDKLVGVRTRQIQKKLKDVEKFSINDDREE